MRTPLQSTHASAHRQRQRTNRVARSAQRPPGAVSSKDDGGLPGQPSQLEKVADRLATLFPVWVFLGATIGILKPSAVTWFSSTIFTYALGFLMLSMGLTLTVRPSASELQLLASR